MNDARRILTHAEARIRAFHAVAALNQTARIDGRPVTPDEADAVLTMYEGLPASARPAVAEMPAGWIVSLAARRAGRQEPQP